MSLKLKLLRCLLLILLVPAVHFASSASGEGLIEAAKNKDWPAVIFLLQQKVDVNAKAPDGATALHWAAHWDNLETAERLIRAGANVDAANDYGVTSLSLACTNGSAAMVQKLLNAGANANATAMSGEPALLTCAHTGSVTAVQALLAHGAEVNAKDSRRGQTALMRAVAQKHADVVRSLIDRGADVRARSKDGFSPLLFAAREGDLESAKILLAAGAEVNESSSEFGAPLLLAASSGHQDLALLLLQRGANPNAADRYGATGLHYALSRGIASLNGASFANYTSYLIRPNMLELTKALLARGADPNARIEKPCPLGGKDSQSTVGATPFLLAATTDAAAIMRLLAAAGADSQAVTKSKWNAVMLAAGIGRNSGRREGDGDALEAVKLAVELGVEVNTADGNGVTALHGAARNGEDEVIEFLAQKGVHLDAQDKYGQTAWILASAIAIPTCLANAACNNRAGKLAIRTSTANLLLRLGAAPITSPMAQQANAAPDNAGRE